MYINATIDWKSMLFQSLKFSSFILFLIIKIGNTSANGTQIPYSPGKKTRRKNAKAGFKLMAGNFRCIREMLIAL